MLLLAKVGLQLQQIMMVVMEEMLHLTEPLVLNEIVIAMFVLLEVVLVITRQAAAVEMVVQQVQVLCMAGVMAVQVQMEAQEVQEEINARTEEQAAVVQAEGLRHVVDVMIREGLVVLVQAQLQE